MGGVGWGLGFRVQDLGFKQGRDLHHHIRLPVTPLSRIFKKKKTHPLSASLSLHRTAYRIPGSQQLRPERYFLFLEKKRRRRGEKYLGLSSAGPNDIAFFFWKEPGVHGVEQQRVDKHGRKKVQARLLEYVHIYT
jgi:hypothetical protein